MRGTDLLSNLLDLGREWLDERRVGWAFVFRNDVGTARLLYVGPERSPMSLQEAVELFVHVLTGARTVDRQLALLDFYRSELLLSGNEVIGFEFRKVQRSAGGSERDLKK